jgi:hypothetical protein
MMKQVLSLAVIVASAMLTGCAAPAAETAAATPSPAPSTTAVGEREFETGSNMAKRKPAAQPKKTVAPTGA